MLISVTIKNWMSFADEATLTLVPGREKNHKERLSFIPEYKLRLSPVAAIYGANASGKSNFFKAIEFCKNLVLLPPNKNVSIRTIPNKLIGKEDQEFSRFSFEFFADESCYAYEFEIKSGKIYTEQLTKILKTTEKVLYSRDGQGFSFSKELEKDERLSFIAKGTRENVLFLSNSVDQQVDIFKSVYEWFEKLIVVFPTSRFPIFSFLKSGMVDISGFGTGVEQFALKDVSSDRDYSGFSKFLSGPDDFTRSVTISDNDEEVTLSQDGDDIKAHKVVSIHEGADGEDVVFELSEESDGTNRLLHLCPHLDAMCKKNDGMILLIDELDRSLHTLATRTFIAKFLQTCSPESRNQLIFSTHDLLLMDQDLLRRDEMWITEKDQSGSSSLFSFADFKEIRKDKDLRKSYLLGRFGGIPKVIQSIACSTGKE